MESCEFSTTIAISASFHEKYRRNVKKVEKYWRIFLSKAE
jgi:hypothetical protein